ncbi:hypothetical protein [Salirhabdus salicampi]|uniref:hypothetical protein n=1 Tax=Salirhabdus salicampi TaxID=476102 RepID=UPI0020C2957D|nr:hypothetical protein [Salirhabdus salicampi]MCP8616650.1 hypothetical protein [Salirhabdus salicampi]
MIVQIKGNVNYAITLDPSVWIFDDRKVLFDDAFTSKSSQSEENSAKEMDKLWDREVYQQQINPPVNKSISKFERKQVLENTYVMPLAPFLQNAELNDNAQSIVLKTEETKHELPIQSVLDGYFLFAIDGRPIKENGPVHFYFGDGSNKDTPIQGVREIFVQ